jgi:signal peptidase II
LIAILAIIVVLVLIALGRNLDSRAGVVSLGLVLGGALGNLTDRALRDGTGILGGAVIDFIDLQWWPVFNVADIAVTIGGVLLVLTTSHDST